MKLLFFGLALVLLAGLVVALVIRFLPVTVADIPPVGPRKVSGNTVLAGGHYAVRKADTITLDALEAQIMATARTISISGTAEDLPMIFVHRSAVWGFPDITQVWVEDGNVHIYSHLVYGRSDLGVNRKRMQGWLAALGV